MIDELGVFKDPCPNCGVDRDGYRILCEEHEKEYDALAWEVALSCSPAD